MTVSSPRSGETQSDAVRGIQLDVTCRPCSAYERNRCSVPLRCASSLKSCFRSSMPSLATVTNRALPPASVQTATSGSELSSGT